MKQIDVDHYFEGFEKSKRSLEEEAILAFWQEHSIFQKTLEKPSPKGEYIFYEGPPTANGRPGIHHFLARSFKDALPRYKTMRGYHVDRKAGWDTHGLPVELQVEKALGLNSKKEILQYGLEKFNDACKLSVWEYTHEWEAMTKRMAYWVDMENPYITYETPYIESEWNILKKVSDDGLLYKDFRITPWCPRCGTTLSSHELAQGYEDVKDLSVTAAFELVNPHTVFPDISGTMYVLAWTTTPWTLFGNVALAVGPEIEYSLIKKGGEEVYYIVAKDLASKVFGVDYESLPHVLGKDLAGVSYKPLFDYASEIIKANSSTEQFEQAYKIHTADFVTTTDGTGVVHTAVMYGADDFDLGTKIGLPKVHLVNQDGTYMEGLAQFTGRFVKDEEVAIDIIKELASHGNLFSKLKYEHSYPHCWRCKTPIIYYARDSWYIAMSKLAQTMIDSNETINWNPNHIKEGRFGEWLRGVKDWSLSRERYWGTPLPVWVAPSGKRITIGSLKELSELSTKPVTTFVLMRHGFGTHLVNSILSGDLKNDTAVLTDEGILQIKDAAQKFKDVLSKVDVIYVSPFKRTAQSLEILTQELGLMQEVIVDERLREVNFGTFNGKNHDMLAEYFKDSDMFDLAYPEGESLKDVQLRVASFAQDVQDKHPGKTVLVVSHDDALTLLCEIANGITTRKPTMNCFSPAEVRVVTTTKLPVNHQGEVDLHKPFIDSITLEKDGETYTRVPEVIDCWFDSGSMPYAQHHAPFDGELTTSQYPADYITEGLDQTRGWFYTLLAISAIMGKPAPYKNVICLGLLLDDKGQKMSKSKGNIVSPWKIFSSVGSDVARMWLYGVNQPGESKSFDLSLIQDLERKLFVIFENCLEFYKLSPDTQTNLNESVIKNATYLDKWLLAYSNNMKKEITQSLEKYDLFNATRTLRDFVTELSQWYVRRSRESLKEEGVVGDATRHVYRIVLRDITLLMAPFAPFHSEKFFREVKFATDPLSVHLADWPEYSDEIDELLLEEMDQARNIITQILKERDVIKVKVRQPLASVTIDRKFHDDVNQIIKDEVNVKEVFVSIETMGVSLDGVLTDELILEGIARELTRSIQSKRKNLGMTVDQSFEINVKHSDLTKQICEKYSDDILKKTKTTITLTDDLENIETIASSLGDIHIEG